MLRRMSPRQFREWRIFEELEPFGSERQDQNFGSVVQVLMNVNRRKGSRKFTLADATLKFGDAPKRQKTDWRRMKMVGQIMTADSQIEAAKQPRRKKRGA